MLNRVILIEGSGKREHYSIYVQQVSQTIWDHLYGKERRLPKSE